MHNSRFHIAAIGALAALVGLHGARGVRSTLVSSNELELLSAWDMLSSGSGYRPRAKHGSHKQRRRQQLKAVRTRRGRRQAQHRK